jgi:hypothetical protein
MVQKTEVSYTVKKNFGFSLPKEKTFLKLRVLYPGIFATENSSVPKNYKVSNEVLVQWRYPDSGFG